MIKDALTELMEEKGFDAITVRDITEKANINRGTFYLHYRDKYDLLEQSEEEILKKLEEIALEVRRINPKDFNFQVNKHFPFVIKLFEYFQENSRFMKVILSPMGDLSFQDKIKNVIKKNVIENVFSKLKKEDLLVPVEFIIAYITSAHLGVIQQWLNSGMNQSPQEISLILYNITVHGPIVVIGLGPELSK